MTTRTQLSMYVEQESEASELESARQILDPVQANLIPAHLTLCREDELSGLEVEVLESRLVSARAITLRFGNPERFAEHGILLPCIAGEDEFHQLRKQALGVGSVRYQAPHITLAHPRNPKSAGNSLVNTPSVETPITFSSIKLITQRQRECWRVLRAFQLVSS